MTFSFFKNTTLLFLGLFVFLACEKNNIEPNLTIDESSSEINFRSENCDCDDKIAAVESDGEMLHFTSVEDLLAVEGCLKQRIDAHIAAFDEAHADLDDESFNDLADESGFDENQPLRDQEAIWGITSLFTTLDDAFNQWLEESSEELDMTTYPGGHTILSEPLQALINSNGDVSIGGEIMNPSVLTSEDEEDEGEDNDHVCKKNGYDYKAFHHSNGKRKMIVEASVYYIPLFFQRWGSKTRSLRLKNNGKWARNRMKHLYTELAGDRRNIGSCDFSHTVNTIYDRTKVRKSHISASETLNWRYPFFLLRNSGEIKGIGYDNVITRNLPL